MSKATREARADEIRKLQEGAGRFVLRNTTASDIILPKPSLDPEPKRQVGPYGWFIGDSYHYDNMRDLVRIEQTLDAPESDVPQAAAMPQMQPPVSNLDAAGMLTDES